MEISSKQFKDVHALLERVVEERDNAKAEARALKIELGDYDTVLDAEKGRRERAEADLKVTNKRYKQLISANCATEATLKEAVEIMTKLSDKIAVYEPSSKAVYQNKEFEDMLVSFDERA